MVIRLFAFVLVVPLAACSDDPIQPAEDSTFGSEREILDAGAVRLLIDNRGGIGRSSADLESVGEFPSGSSNNYLFSSGLWVGGLSRGTPVVSTTADRVAPTSEFLPGRRIGQGTGGGRILCSGRSVDLERWYPEFRGGTTGAPVLLGDEDCVVIFHDGNPSLDVQTPIGLEVRQRSVSFTTGLAAQAVVFVWEFEIGRLEPLTDAYAAVFLDVDIGSNFSDDRCSAVVQVPPGPNNPVALPLQTNLLFCWDDDFEETDFAPKPPGFIGVSFLRAPAEVGSPVLSRATQMGNSFAGGLPNDPATDGSQHELMVGDFTWSPFFTIQPRDARSVAITGPFTLLPGEPRELVAAILWADAPAQTEGISVDLERCFPAGKPCFLPDPNDPALAELIAVQQAVQQLVDERLPAF